MATAVLNHHATAAQALAGTTATSAATDGKAVKQTASTSSGTSTSSSDSDTISSSDFLTLLVTEMKNQDPTSATDPNQYINQLVNVNSLQQLIQINQTLTADSTQTVAQTTGSGSAKSAAADAIKPAGTAPQSATPGAQAAKVAPGNLGIPAASQAASRVAQSLSGRARTQ